MSRFFLDFEHHFQVSVGDCIPNSWVMLKITKHQDLLPTPVIYIIYIYSYMIIQTMTIEYDIMKSHKNHDDSDNPDGHH